MDKKKFPRSTRPSSGNAGSVFFANSGLSMPVTTQPTRRLRRSLAAHPTRTLRAWCVQAAGDAGERDDLTSDQRARLKALERENKELRQANEILKKASAYFAQAELDRPFRK